LFARSWMAAVALASACAASIESAQAGETVLHDLTAGVIMCPKGELYGTTGEGGAGRGGVVFKLTPPTYAETVLVDFAFSGPALVNGCGVPPRRLIRRLGRGMVRGVLANATIPMTGGD
jgi:uncharacterized repeat protein (TIGR03803 family)